MSRVTVANAPVSFGAFEMTVGRDPNVPNGAQVLRLVGEAGYEGIDLGPTGYLGSGHGLAANLRSAGLALAGGYLPIPFCDRARTEAAMAELDTLLDAFDAASERHRFGIRPRPTIADAGSPERAGTPGRAATDRALGWDDDGWRRAADEVRRVSDRARSRGYEPTFHPHVGTYVEAPWEVERLLELTDVGLCLDTGHLSIGGGDPVEALRDWGGRVDHVHLKDADAGVVEAIVAEGAPMFEVWTRGAFVSLGAGDIDIDGVIAGLARMEYGGWVVVEQDRILGSGVPVEHAAREQRANRDFLRARGW